ncbi:PQQ-dependent sugar dehydrogenase [Actinomadura logoneensis]|uniref:PQQ-dependent sugar dehydrogenase n=1 Tax=Actinomadura logoneensis TaxID=2293572 RepID=A0A372JMN0_9ACTN|nr:PQQ-dependent sugar dehydrogenase [Actinomadura logoneensis]RFU41275.1 PQQ-dependent sugar dehydrogenase [Actinomadura logoneensis]
MRTIGTSGAGTRLLAAVLGTVLLGGCGSIDPTRTAQTPPPVSPAPDSPPPGTAVPGTPRDLVTGLSVPWAIAFLPNRDALVTERDTAHLLRVTPDGRRTDLGRVPGVVPSGEGGLLGVAVSPSFDRDHRVYLYFTSATDNRLARLTLDGDRLGAPQPLLTGAPKGQNHNGGRIAFGPDGMLYIGTGETYRTELAQDRASLGGKILRVTPDGKPAPGNPFNSPVWTWGHRNVQGLAWDDANRLYATEFGQDRFDEINLVQKGRNYGWPKVEGFGKDARYTNPLLTWPTSEASPSGLAYAKGSLWAAALRGTRLWQVPLNNGKPGTPIAYFNGAYGRLRAVVRAPDGNLWVTTSNHDGRGDPKPGDDRILVLPLR